MKQRPWYLPHGKTCLVMLLTAGCFYPLIAGAIDLWQRSCHEELVAQNWVLSVRCISMGLHLFWIFGVLASAMLCERWLRLLAKLRAPAPERTEI
jgi:hypothetical protein